MLEHVVLKSTPPPSTWTGIISNFLYPRLDRGARSGWAAVEHMCKTHDLMSFLMKIMEKWTSIEPVPSIANVPLVLKFVRE